MAKIGYIQVTRKCNQHCLFCSNPENQRQIGLSQAQIQCESLIEEGYEWVILTGGEPTLHPQLVELVTTARALGLRVRMISNGQSPNPLQLLKQLKKVGLEHLHLSLHSYKPDVQAYLTGKADSLDCLMSSLRAAENLEISCDINTVICAQNSDHLDETVAWVRVQAPWVKHFVFNNLDAHMNRVLDNPHTVPNLVDLELCLHRALRLLEAESCSFRVERLPLCFMADFAHAATETRKIVKEEGRTVHFLDEKGQVSQQDFQHRKFEACTSCRLESICAGLDCGPDGEGQAYDPNSLHAIFLDPEAIRQRILSEP
ncbi:MAG: radical SAM protein [Deltaproteobacteria bacterium]|nr:radical SAM protein [Deltaproteobacteria bacterium]